ncbi:hypothetical protein CAC42_1002 [Sphaceloma murrayae]|uniref:Uncharacterized protein n=1 Tax=Sphaceloma murrayae TaxID=2082308 RepID=A0A2K1R211_9PEZI|nr:hypothetical protein CAC42_1002 [Sphaceloma murrayae]
MGSFANTSSVSITSLSQITATSEWAPGVTPPGGFPNAPCEVRLDPAYAIWEINPKIPPPGTVYITVDQSRNTTVTSRTCTQSILDDDWNAGLNRTAHFGGQYGADFDEDCNWQGKYIDSSGRNSSVATAIYPGPSTVCDLGDQLGISFTTLKDGSKTSGIYWGSKIEGKILYTDYFTSEYRTYENAAGSSYSVLNWIMPSLPNYFPEWSDVMKTCTSIWFNTSPNTLTAANFLTSITTIPTAVGVSTEPTSVPTVLPGETPPPAPTPTPTSTPPPVAAPASPPPNSSLSPSPGSNASGNIISVINGQPKPTTTPTAVPAPAPEPSSHSNNQPAPVAPAPEDTQPSSNRPQGNSPQATDDSAAQPAQPPANSPPARAAPSMTIPALILTLPSTTLTLAPGGTAGILPNGESISLALSIPPSATNIQSPGPQIPVPSTAPAVVIGTKTFALSDLVLPSPTVENPVSAFGVRETRFVVAVPTPVSQGTGKQQGQGGAVTGQGGVTLTLAPSVVVTLSGAVVAGPRNGDEIESVVGDIGRYIAAGIGQGQVAGGAKGNGTGTGIGTASATGRNGTVSYTGVGGRKEMGMALVGVIGLMTGVLAIGL